MAAVEGLLERVLEAVGGDAELFGPGGACPVLREPAAGAPRVLLVTGENAGGKSFLTKFLHARFPKDVEFMRIGMAFRTESGIARSFVYGGSEADHSTGQLSVNAVEGGIRTCRERAAPHAICWDEPDIGLSGGYAMAMGETLRRFCADLPDATAAAVVVTHSREIAAAVASLGPHMLRVGDDLRPTAQWLREGPLPRSPEDLERLGEASLERYRAIHRVLDGRKRAREARRQEACDAGVRREKAALAARRAEPDRPDLVVEHFAALLGLPSWQDPGPTVAVADGVLSVDGEEVGAVSAARTRAGRRDGDAGDRRRAADVQRHGQRRRRGAARDPGGVPPLPAALGRGRISLTFRPSWHR